MVTGDLINIGKSRLLENGQVEIGEWVTCWNHKRADIKVGACETSQKCFLCMEDGKVDLTKKIHVLGSGEGS